MNDCKRSDERISQAITWEMWGEWGLVIAREQSAALCLSAEPVRERVSECQTHGARWHSATLDKAV